MKIKNLLLLFLVCLPVIVHCQDVQFTANAPSVVRVGEQFRLTYSVNAKVNDFKYSDMSGFSVLAGPNPSTSSNFQWINGQSSQSVSTVYTFYLAGNSVGEFTIQPATVNVGKKSYQSNALKINVVQGNSGNQGGGASNQGGVQGNSGSNSGSSNVSGDNKNVFVVGSASKRDVYVGEQFVFSHKIYTKLDLAGFGDIKFPAYTGFWKEDVNIGNINLQRTTLNNDVYYYDEIQRNILFPQKTGDIVIEPAEVQVVARVRTRQSGGMGDPFFDSFFQSYQNVNYNCKTKPITIHVMPLPAQGQPGSFSGAVGVFTMTGTIDKTSLKANEAITLKFTISGSGNVRLIDKLNIQFPYDFEVYEPKVTENVSVNNDAVSGTKVFEYVVIPRNPGSFTIPSFDFSFFNPSKKSYVVLNSPEFVIEVDNSGVETQSVQRVDKEDIITLGEDVRFIKTKTPNFKTESLLFFATPMYFLILIIIVIVIVTLMFIFRKYSLTRSDVEGMKRRRADNVAMKRLKTAKDYLDAKNHDKFYDELSNALWKYISDKFNVPNSELNRDYLVNLAKEGKISEDDANRFITVISNAEFARFAPGSSNDSMADMYSQAVDVIKLFYSKLK